MAVSKDRADVKKVVKEFLELVGITPKKISVGEGEDMIIDVAVSEEESGLLIGYHGETLGALQYLVGQALNRGKETWQRVMININGYRDQREVQLKQMAQNAADRAVSSGDEIEMPYLTPAERRIIHLELSERTDVTSFSEGEARNRRLIVAPKKSETAAPK